MTQIDLERKNSICSEGVHTFKITKSEEKGPGASGFPYWNFSLQCVDEGPDKGQMVWAVVSLAPQARFKLDQFLDAVGAPESGSVSHENFIGKTLRCSIKWDSYDGKVTAKPDSFIQPGATVTDSKPKSQTSASKNALPSDVTGSGFKKPF